MLLTLAMVAALGTPTYDLTDNTLSVASAELAVVRGPSVTLVQGLPLIDDGIAWADDGDLVWELAPGVYTVTAFAPPTPDGMRDEVAWEIEVQEPRPLGRPEQIRVAVFGLFEAIARWRALAPTDAEIFAAVRAGPLTHPTQAGAETP